MKVNEYNRMIGRKLDQFVTEYLKATGKTKLQFLNEVGVYQPSVYSRWVSGKTGIAPVHFDKICETLDKSKSDFIETPEEMYQFDPEYINSYGRRLEKYGEHIGLNMKLLEGLRDLIDFDREYPLQTPITYDVQIKATDIEVDHDHPLLQQIDPDGRFRGVAAKEVHHYYRLPAERAMDSAKMEKRFRYFQMKQTVSQQTDEGETVVENDVTFSPLDIGFLDMVQDEVVKTVLRCFQWRRQEMDRQIEMLNERERIMSEDPMRIVDGEYLRGEIYAADPIQRHAEAFEEYEKEVLNNGEYQKEG